MRKVPRVLGLPDTPWELRRWSAEEEIESVEEISTYHPQGEVERDLGEQVRQVDIFVRGRCGHCTRHLYLVPSYQDLQMEVSYAKMYVLEEIVDVIVESL